MANTALNRSVVAIKTNKSGGAHAQGDVCVEGTSTANSVINDTSGAYINGAIWVCLEPDGVADNASGLYASMGYVPKLNLSGSASLGDLVKTHTAAKQGVRHAAPVVAGDFAIVLGTGTSPAAWLFGLPYQGSGTGAPSTAKYVTAALDGSLSAEIVIPGLAGSPDIAGAAGAGVAHEFDSGASPLSWSVAVDTETVNSTIKSHLFVQDNGAGETLGTYSWSPAGAFDLRAKVSLGVEMGTNANGAGAGLIVGASAMNNFCMIQLIFDGTTEQWQIKAYTYASGYTQRGATSVIGHNSVYFRITRDGSNNNSFYYSLDGLTWLLVATQALTYTTAKAGLRLAPDSQVTSVAVDWIRSDV